MFGRLGRVFPPAHFAQVSLAAGRVTPDFDLSFGSLAVGTLAHALILPIPCPFVTPFIDVRARRCIVSRFTQAARFEFSVQPAANWPDLEDEARRAVEDQIGAITEDDHFPCPPDLADQAIFPD